VGSAIVDYLRSSYGSGVILIVKDGVGLGWMGFAPRIPPSVIESISVPLDTPSVFSMAQERRAVFCGAPTDDTGGVQARFFEVLEVKPPEEVVTAPIVLSKRVVNLIYAHGFDGKALPDTAGPELTRLAKAAADAFVRLIKKSKSQVPGSRRG
jgi:hypothetical protein